MSIEVGQLIRTVNASAERAIEDELDWEHLPFTHASTFSGVTLRSSDRNGWDADVILRDGAQMRMTVLIDEDRLGYANTTFAADSGAETGRAVCRIDPLGEDRCRMTLRFFIPEQPGVDRDAVGAFYIDLFGRLIDEDEPKMIYRTRAIAAGAEAHLARRQVTLADGTVCDVPLVCPHQGLPLDGDPDAEGVMQCPWHGYRFDARTGACIRGRSRGWRNARR